MNNNLTASSKVKFFGTINGEILYSGWNELSNLVSVLYARGLNDAQVQGVLDDLRYRGYSNKTATKDDEAFHYWVLEKAIPKKFRDLYDNRWEPIKTYLRIK